jgi:hypothetical protein
MNYFIWIYDEIFFHDKERVRLLFDIKNFLREGLSGLILFLKAIRFKAQSKVK